MSTVGRPGLYTRGIMSEQLKVTLAGGQVEYLALTAKNAHELESLISARLGGEQDGY